MIEISVTQGFGPIKFGATPNEVKKAWGAEALYEDWMGGNLENFLFFKGLLVGFRGEISDHPNPNSVVCMFQIKAVHPLNLWGQQINDLSKHDIETILERKNMKFQEITGNIVRCIDQELQFSFNDKGILDEVYFATKDS
jgi:hypothetical protein